MRPIRGGYLSFYNREGLRGISFSVMAAPPFTVTVSGILRSALSVYNNDIGVFWFNVVVLLS